jgi:hypothetical protein
MFGMTLLFQDLYDDTGILFKHHNIQIEIFNPLAKQLLLYLQTELPITGLNFLYNYSSRAKFMSSFVLLTENIKNLFTNILTEEGRQTEQAYNNIITCINNYSDFLVDTKKEEIILNVSTLSALHSLSKVNFKLFYQMSDVFKTIINNHNCEADGLLEQDFCQKLSTLYILEANYKVYFESLSKETISQLLEVFELASINIDHKYNVNTTSHIKDISDL